MRSNFLWGGATAANQYEGGYRGYNEGGRGVSVNDVEMSAVHSKAREVHDIVREGCYYPSHKATDFITAIKRISR